MSEQISLLLDGELSREDATRVRSHLVGCAECRRVEEEFCTIRSRIRSYDPPHDYAASRRTLHAILNPLPRSRTTVARRGRLVAVCVVPVLLLAAALVVMHRRAPDRYARPTTGWMVARLAGEPQIGGRGLVNADGRLTVGEWLVTDGDARASVAVADIGRVEVAPGSRLRLVGTNPTEHRLALEHGRISATIHAPPRLFFVDTPSAVAIDYGCAYTLEVDDAGASRLRVTAGWVALEAAGQSSFVPAGASCMTRPGAKPGTPYYDDAVEPFRHALTELDFGGGGAARTNALATLLRDSRRRDSLTLWHLLARTSDAERERVYERLTTLAPPPPDVTREDVLRLDKEALDRWKVSVDAARYEDAP